MSENNQSTSTSSSRRRHSIFGPLLLIAAGVVFLLNNLGVLPGDFWDVVVNLWPLILVLSGLDALLRREGIAWPTLLITVGTFLLLRNLDVVSWRGWGRLWQLWPLILVALGIDLIFKERTLLRAIFGVLIVVALVGGGMWLVGFSGVIADARSVEAQQALGEDVSRAELSIALGAGELYLTDTTEKEFLVTGEVSSKTGHEHYSETSGTATYTLESGSKHVYTNNIRWNLGLSPLIPLDLTTEMGAGLMVLDLEELQLDNLLVEQGVGNLVIHLPAQGIDQVEVDQAVGQIRVSIPSGMALRLEVSKAITELDIPQNFSRNGNYYFSPNYDEADEVIELKISQAIGRIEVEYSR